MTIRIPRECEVCETFNALFNTEDLSGDVMTRRERLVIGFRAAHHVEGGALLDRGWLLLRWLKDGGWPEGCQRETIRLAVIAGL